MMYSSKLAAAIKVDGKILREQGDAVALPVGTEYSVFIKNLNSVRAKVSVWIDGVNVTNGYELIVMPHSTLDLERFIENGNFDRGNKFKFIERTKRIEDGPRGIRIDDGLVRIEYKFEKQPDYSLINAKSLDLVPLKSSPYSVFRGIGSSEPFYSANSSTSQYTLDSHDVAFASAASQVEVNGITVAGSESTQKFVVGAHFQTEATSHTMILRLVGTIGEKPVEKPITVKHKPKCETCGHQNKANSKFCVECGTALERFA